ncbi:uncharacterized protein FOMMEDRAFT_20320 [Fomitiporia mediterranea MF3/22]|uniref:uncharacterized protein n=1 Tax=Fomitiporia mediterranea (strain MF3/22) TaxID=694068 RepID=UPI0004408955|nr:uncharacterized protein FOMMEDRAFT_20320 [Fomitiporia mediterranea MF3/22]EJD03162.1 hypothetical protein FOMMEDRAFT_20320 [Fomitiporia mediterranea MF3/22]
MITSGSGICPCVQARLPGGDEALPAGFMCRPGRLMALLEYFLSGVPSIPVW